MVFRFFVNLWYCSHMLKKVVFGVVLNGLALYLVTKFLPGQMTYTGGILFFALGGLVIGTLNTFVKPLMHVLSLPLLIFSIGLFSLVINAIIFWLTVKLVNVIDVAGVTVTVLNGWTYLWAALIFGLVNWLLHMFFHNK